MDFESNTIPVLGGQIFFFKYTNNCYQLDIKFVISNRDAMW